jgi:hypothetical protein
MTTRKLKANLVGEKLEHEQAYVSMLMKEGSFGYGYMVSFDNGILTLLENFFPYDFFSGHVKLSKSSDFFSCAQYSATKNTTT